MDKSLCIEPPTPRLTMATKKACWSGYEKRGTKKKGGKTVNNCLKKGTKSKAK